MSLLQLSRSALWFLLSACTALALNAAEIELNRETHATGTLVRLSDVATIHSADPLLAARLGAAELFPAPPVEGWTRLNQRDLLELLELRGFDALEISLSGASEATIYGPGRVVTNRQPAVMPADIHEATPLPSIAPPAKLQEGSQAAKASDSQTALWSNPRLEQAIADYLRRAAGSNYQWEVESQLTAEEARLFAVGALEVSGGEQPYTGQQTFTVKLHRAEGVTEHLARADVNLPQRVVAAVRPLSAGDTLAKDDLQWIIPTAATAKRAALQEMEAAVGMELVRGVAAGQALESEMLRRPILVKRNAVAQLSVRSGGVTVGTKVRAMDDGAAGDSIRVQSLFDRQQYTAVVVGPEQLEISMTNDQ